MESLLLIASLTVVLAGAIVWWIIPRIVDVVRHRNLFDIPDGERKIHELPTPVLGGIAIFLGFFVVLFISVELLGIEVNNFFVLSLICLLFIGMYDDLMSITARSKLILQITFACLVLYESTGWITDFNGVFYIQAIPMWVAIPLSVFVIVLLINAYNMIDGVDGLASSQGAIAFLLFGAFFLASGELELMLISFAMAGAMIGFLLHNRPPARIFMGDTGSLVVGFVLGFIAVEYISTLGTSLEDDIFSYTPVFVVAILIVPLYDILRIIIIRKISGRSIFSSSRDHIHHVLQDYGLGSLGVSIYLACVQILVFMSALGLSQFGVDINIVLAVIVLMAGAMLPLGHVFVPILSVFGLKPKDRPPSITATMAR